MIENIFLFYRLTKLEVVTLLELDGAKLCFDYLQKFMGLAIKVFVSDCHQGIAKWIKECNPSVTSGTLQRGRSRNCWLLAKRRVVTLLVSG